MAGSRRLEAELERLEVIAAEGNASAAQPELERALREGAALVTARAAAICADSGLMELEEALVAGWDRILAGSAKHDKGCRAKTALARALVRLDCDCEALFLAGIRLRQPEPVWGGSVDTAAELRGICAAGLAQLQVPEAANELAVLLADAETEARLGAARALAQLDAWRAEPLLRLKILSGEADLKVLGECFLSLLRLAPENGVDFVSRFLTDADPARGEAAALALGESRLETALPPLRRVWEEIPDRDLRRTVLLAIAMLHTEPALEFLLQLAREEALPTAVEAVAALALYRHDEELLSEVQKIAAARGDGLSDLVRREFLLER